MELVARFCWCAMLQMLNWSIYLGMALAALLALRPMTRRLLEPRQRVALWGVVWLSFCLPQWINLLDRVPLPFTLRSFLTPRTYCDSGFDHFPMYLPEITGEGTYHLALPGGFSIPIQVSWQGMVLLVLLGAAYFVVIFSLARWSDRGVGKLASQGRALETEDYERLGLTMAEGQSIKLCPDLPTSFVLRRKGGHDILLQRELTGEQMKLVLIHEREHVKQRHPWLQGIASAVWILNFCNPLVWLAYRAFRLDMELACDQGVLEQLDVEGRRSYARTLVELASDRPVWGGVTSFGECDAALRVRQAANWQPDYRSSGPGTSRSGDRKTVLGWAAAAALAAFLLAGGPYRALDADVLDVMERYQIWSMMAEEADWDEDTIFYAAEDGSSYISVRFQDLNGTWCHALFRRWFWGDTIDFHFTPDGRSPDQDQRLDYWVLLPGGKTEPLS